MLACHFPTCDLGYAEVEYGENSCHRKFIVNNGIAWWGKIFHSIPLRSFNVDHATLDGGPIFRIPVHIEH